MDTETEAVGATLKDHEFAHLRFQLAQVEHEQVEQADSAAESYDAGERHTALLELGCAYGLACALARAY